ncbi:bifunctional metallophosphatase/5'-nucleotidase [Laceyella putida]|uniref:Bifunctional metallophosphatase/5'-nucleotidase n=1 Tax=Laceyella putida TaxID=110101 RepID=A0ABW2RLL9_9BACL
MPIRYKSHAFVLFIALLCTFLILSGFHWLPAAPPPVQVQLLGINDFHGQLDQTRQWNKQAVGTAPVLATYLKERAATNPNTLLVQAGDMVGASAPESALLQDEPTIEILNHLGFDIGTVGNHEFDEGIPEMKRLIYGGYHEKTGYFAGADFPYVVANVIDKKTGRPILPAHFIKRVKGIPIGFIGVVTTETPQIVMPTHVENVKFTDPATAVNQEVRKLKRKGVETIVVLAHEGGTQDQNSGTINGPIAEIVPRLNDEVDVVFSGHTHTFIHGMIDGKLVVQALNYGMAFADVDLTIDRRTKDVVAKQAEVLPTYQANVEPDPEVKRIVEEAKAKVAPLINREIAKTNAAITRTDSEAGESALGNLIADAQRATMQTEFAFMNPGGIRADLPAGTITWGHLYTVQPFGNDLVKMTLTGAQIRTLLNQQFQDPSRIRILQISGLRYTYDPNRPADDRVVSIVKADGTPLDPAATYSVTVNSFLASGGDGFTVLKEGTDRTVGPTDLDALVEYVKQLPQPFGATIEGRITLEK